MTPAVLAATRRLSGIRRSGGDALSVALGFGIASAGGVYLAARAMQWVAGTPAAVAALEATAFTAAATGLGALPVLAARRVSPAAGAVLLGFGAGVMLAASLLSLLLPAFESAAALVGSADSAAALVAAGTAAGALALAWVDRSLPHRHLPAAPAAAPDWRPGAPCSSRSRLRFTTCPKGFAVGASTASGAGAALTLGIALQNLPEGFVVATALAALGHRARQPPSALRSPPGCSSRSAA